MDTGCAISEMEQALHRGAVMYTHLMRILCRVFHLEDQQPESSGSCAGQEPESPLLLEDRHGQLSSLPAHDFWVCNLASNSGHGNLCKRCLEQQAGCGQPTRYALLLQLSVCELSGLLGCRMQGQSPSSRCSGAGGRTISSTRIAKLISHRCTRRADLQ